MYYGKYTFIVYEMKKSLNVYEYSKIYFKLNLNFQYQKQILLQYMNLRYFKSCDFTCSISKENPLIVHECRTDISERSRLQFDTTCMFKEEIMMTNQGKTLNLVHEMKF